MHDAVSVDHRNTTATIVAVTEEGTLYVHYSDDDGFLLAVLIVLGEGTGGKVSDLYRIIIM